ncbi:IF-2B-domain-containing protein [Artomyces pyxidatus]|uniref:IF-2B-domain-containing protein n=1 Tax=Artomyces pyxidatus TaxID=48021 RepID=A0ACB8TKN7_9AGAM|nr:IF-2B-domain-containing protein [Artomyces pyxidatus]
MTKAERRELQERQRAAKAAKTAAGPAAGTPTVNVKGGGGGKLAQPSTPASPAPKKGGTSQGAAQAKALAAAVVTGPAKGAKDAKAAAGVGEDIVGSRGLRIFSHFALQKTAGHVAKGDVHPAIVRLGLMFAEFKVCGANARCIATLSVFKQVIQDYVTPQHNTLSRHLNTHLSVQISHLVSARPMSVTMGNAIRQLKLEISGSDIDLPEQDAKDELCHKIDNYIRDRIIIADQVIQETAMKKIHDGDVVLTYARSSVVEQVLLEAWSEGTQFSVYVVDSRPMLEGKRLLSVLAAASIPCTYLLLPALGSVITEISTVFVGAHSIHSNGAVYSRAGTALVAMMAKQHSVPVVVCCETYKFSEGVQLDSFTKNELAPLGDRFSSFPLTRPRESLTLQNRPNLEILNPLYDLTPPSSITAVVTEVGVIPPDSISSIPLALGRQMI